MLVNLNSIFLGKFFTLKLIFKKQKKAKNASLFTYF